MAFQRVADAYKTLGDPELRKKYDEGSAVRLREIEVKRQKKKAKKERRMKRLMNRNGGYAYDPWGYGGYGGYGGRGRFGQTRCDDSEEDDSESDEEEEQDSEAEEQAERKLLKEEIERKYFPERFEWNPFGDPHEDRKKAAARKAKRRR